MELIKYTSKARSIRKSVQTKNSRCCINNVQRAKLSFNIPFSILQKNLIIKYLELKFLVSYEIFDNHIQPSPAGISIRILPNHYFTFHKSFNLILKSSSTHFLIYRCLLVFFVYSFCYTQHVYVLFTFHIHRCASCSYPDILRPLLG